MYSSSTFVCILFTDNPQSDTSRVSQNKKGTFLYTCYDDLMLRWSQYDSFFFFFYLQTNPNYSQEKNRCEYLHNKLAHIKKLIAEYDQQQL